MAAEAWAPRDPALAPAFDAWRAGQHAAAAERFAAALAADERDADAWRGIGSVHWSCGRHAQALDAFRSALALEPQRAMAWANVGLANRELARRAEAVHAFEVAIALDAGYAPAYNEWANVLVDDGRPQPALALYERALELDGTRPVYHHNRGVCLRLLGDVDGAVRGFRRALALDPGYAFSSAELERLVARRAPTGTA